MTLTNENEINPHGEALVEELRRVHDMIRGNLDVIQTLIEEISDGASAEHIHAQVDNLSATNMIWTLRVGCLRYCNFVHSHHHAEDTMLFPGLRRVNPALCPVIDTLEADHRIVSGLLDKVEDAANLLLKEESARETLADALRELARHLLTHLDFEEENLSPTLRRLRSWPLV